MGGLTDYISTWETDYQSRQANIPLLKPEQAKGLTPTQRKYFAELFWHVRGHFAEFLWVLGSKAPDRKSKLVVVDNIADEFGARAENHTSHEVLYNRFAASLGSNTAEYPIGDINYPVFLLEYNRDHLRFLLKNSWDVCAAAFSAYERLDNFDYGAVEEIGKMWGLDKKALEFYEVHRGGHHFREVSEDLMGTWKRDSAAVKKGFEFIGDHQLGMWNNLSNAVFNYKS